MAEPSQNNDKFAANLPTPKKSHQQKLLALGIIAGVLVVGLSITVYLLKTKPTAKRKPPAKMQALVNTMEVFPITTNVKIKALGRVVPAREINMQARVSGKVVYLHPKFIPGGIIRKGEVLVRLDETDYRLALTNKQNILDQARADFRIEEGSQKVAEQEWAMINSMVGEMDQSSEDLALRKPQLAKAQANIKAAETEIERAMVDLERTVIKSPFNAIVREKHVDTGSQVSSQSSIATLSGVDSYWAEISFPVDKLEWIMLPDDKKSGSNVLVYADSITPHQGKIINLLSDIDPDGLMARMIIAIDDPMGLKSKREPLLLGSFIRAEIEGKTIENVFQIPRAALKENNKVMIATSDALLHIKSVSVIWKDTEFVYIDKGIEKGDMIIVSNVPAPIEGMPLEITEKMPDTKIQTSGIKVDEQQ
jgi:RND family efflux transporter MFP subunit